MAKSKQSLALRSPITCKPLNLASKRALWPKTTELLSLEFQLVPRATCDLYPQYTIGLHAWFLQQIQTFDTTLSAYMHDSGAEKPFSLTGLDAQFVNHSQSLQLRKENTYCWRVNALCQPVVSGIACWLRQLPDELVLKNVSQNVPLEITSVRLALPATNYARLLKQSENRTGTLDFSFVSPTSFKRKGHHLPLPWPTNVFHSYLRRWNNFAKKPVDQTAFLDWIDSYVIIQRHQISSVKVAAGKRGSVTGFTGVVSYALDRKAAETPEFCTLFYALSQLAPYCGTGHKTTFGLGETQLGFTENALPQVPAKQQILAERIEALKALFMSQRKRQGGDRALHTAETWATILARREQGDRLDAIAHDMDLPYETAKTYSKLARRAVRASDLA